MGLHLGSRPQHLSVQRVLLAVLECHHDRLIHLVRDDVAFPDLSLISPSGLGHLISPSGLGRLTPSRLTSLITLAVAHAAPSLPATASGDTDRPSSRSCITV